VTASQWEDHAAWWQRDFTEGADAEYREQILPLAIDLLAGCRRVIDIGAGEGQVARGLLAGGADLVVALDFAFNQIAAAHGRGSGSLCVQADAQALPLRSDAFDGALACLMLDHVPDLDRAIGDLARVVQPGGRLVVLVNHPLLQTPRSGWIDDQILEPPEQYWRIGPYLTEATEVDEVVEGVFITFYHRTLSTYLNCLSDNGFDLRHMIEPPPPAGFLAEAPEYLEASTIPRLLALKCERRSG
jgi:ubiquinone/menaquinone biosynthesis C-methylase UbiE